MIHELKEIINQAFIYQKKGLKNVMATVVFLEGSSYRKPGVRMLISEDSTCVGAVSGGCVEKEIIKRSASVFKNGNPKVITYDGRYKLGCEGILYILIEPIIISEKFLSTFLKATANRLPIQIDSYYTKADEVFGNFGSILTFSNQEKHALSDNFSIKNEENTSKFTKILKPNFKLVIIGGEHDAVKLCKIASNLGWQIEVITAAKESKQLASFPGATAVIGTSPEMANFTEIDNNTAIVIMNHSYFLDLKYLVKLAGFKPKYIGILGAPKRREKLFNELLEFAPETTETFLDCIYTPAGLHIGAKTPEEIAVSIIAEILAITRKKEPFSLRKITNKINI